ncbi:MAG: T9SS type A sorting domain-containing protein [Arcicella sp.]|nr:T9SS type A sorting domain-containing protein [Arcicella sp.]
MVINRTRIDTGKEIAWMVSLTSALVRCPTGCVVGPFAPSDENVLEGQRSTIRETSKVFQGPFTDIIQNPGRQDGVHFNGELPKLAEEWSNAMNDNFFQNATPFIPTPVPDIAFNCGDNRVDVTLPDGYNNYEWSDNSLNFNNGRFSNQRRVTLDVAGGRQYFARFRDGNGNVIQVPAISFAGSNIPVSTITATGATDFCEGNRAILKANDAVIYEWNNGSRSQEITVTTSGSYSVRTISQFGCQTNFSNPTIITAKPGPPKPTISANGNTIFCADTNVVLQSSNQDAVNYLWNNGTNSRTLKVNATGSYTVKTVNSQGCLSNESDEIKITVNPLPATPSIVPNGATTFCADTSVVLRSSNQDAVSYRWNTGSTARDVTIRTAGDYSVRTVDRNGCISKSSAATRIRVNTLPPAPSISSTRDTVFCQGDGTILQMALTNGGFPTWLATQDGVVNRFTFSNLNVNRTGSYRGFQTDVNGCKSGLSRAIFVSVKPLPPKVETIQRLSPYTIGIEKPQANVYEWQYNGTNRPDLTASIVRINEAGKYRVTAKNVYKTLSYGEKVCASEPSSEFSFELYDDNGMSIFPNPSKGVFFIDSKIDWRNSTLEVYTLLGALVKKASVSLFDDVKKIDLSDLPEGEYMLRIRSDNFYTISKRIMINR